MKTIRSKVKVSDIRKKCIEFLNTRSLDPIPPYLRRQIYAAKKKAKEMKPNIEDFQFDNEEDREKFRILLEKETPEIADFNGAKMLIFKNSTWILKPKP